MLFTTDDLHIILDALDDTLIVQQAAYLTCRSQYKRNDIKQRINKTTRTKAMLLLMLKNAMEEG